MTLRPETTAFLQELERSSGRRLTNAEVVGWLLDGARARGTMQVFEDIAFLAKFLSKSFDLLRRIGPDGDGADRISSEFQTNVEKVSSLIRTIVKEFPGPEKGIMVEKFFKLDQESLGALMMLMQDLAVVKNWLVDGKPLP